MYKVLLACWKKPIAGTLQTMHTHKINIGVESWSNVCMLTISVVVMNFSVAVLYQGHRERVSRGF